MIGFDYYKIGISYPNSRDIKDMDQNVKTTGICMQKYNEQLIEGLCCLSAGFYEFDRGYDVFMMNRWFCRL